MELHATTVVWEGDGKLTVHDKTQGAQNSQAYVAAVFGLSQGRRAGGDALSSAAASARACGRSTSSSWR